MHLVQQLNLWKALDFSGKSFLSVSNALCIFLKPGIGISCKKRKHMFADTFLLRTFIGVETADLTFRTKQYSTSYSSHICYGKQFYNQFFLNHHTTALLNNFLKLLNCVVIETVLDLVKEKNQLS